MTSNIEKLLALPKAERDAWVDKAFDRIEELNRELEQLCNEVEAVMKKENDDEDN